MSLGMPKRNENVFSAAKGYDYALFTNPRAKYTSSPTTLTDPTGLDGGFHDRPCQGSCSAGDSFSGIVNWWNGLPGWGKAAIIITVIAVVVVATVGIAAPELLPAVPFLLAGDFGVLGGGGAFCEDDPAAC